MINDWWGYDTKRAAWVYLDRSIPCNKPDYKHLPLVFVDCDKNETFQESRENWDEPRMIFEGKLEANGIKADTSVLEMHKKKVKAFKRLLTAYRPTPSRKDVTDIFSASRELSPEQVRRLHGRGCSDEYWQEILSYAEMMKERNSPDIGSMNAVITNQLLWGRFPNIRSINTYSNNVRDKPGITQQAYRLVNRLLNRHGHMGSAELLDSKRY